MGNTKHEDAFMKIGVEYFRDTLLKAFGIDYTYIDAGITELVELTIHSLYMDFTFLTTEDMYIHIEFQSTNSGTEDLRRFHAYEAVLSNKTGKRVITYVIYTNEIKHVKSELNCGIYVYRINPVYLVGDSADDVFRAIEEKQRKEEHLEEEDFARLALTPLMMSSLERKDIICKALLLIKPYTNNSAGKAVAMLYVLADKFLTGSELESIKEVVSMTRLGQMLIDDGIEQGIEQGTERMSCLTRHLLKEKRYDDLQKAAEDNEYREKLMKDYNI